MKVDIVELAGGNVAGRGPELGGHPADRSRVPHLRTAPAHAEPTDTFRLGRRRLLAVVAVVTLTVAVWSMAGLQRETVAASLEQRQAAETTLTGMLDQETGFRGFVQTRRESFLQPYRRGVVEFDQAVATSRRDAAGDAALLAQIEAQVEAARAWQDEAQIAIAELRADPDRPVTAAESAERKEVFDRFRDRNRAVQEAVDARITGRLGSVQLLSSGVVLGLSMLFGVIAFVSIERDAARTRRRYRRQAAYRATQGEFAQTMQVMRDEQEAYELVRTHLERSVPDAGVTVLNRNNSDNHVHTATPVEDGSPLAERLRDATPDSCLAIRLGTLHEGGGEDPPLLTCALCAGERVTCAPALVSGEVIGSVRVTHDRPLDEEERQRIAETVRESSAVLGNLRNLAIAQLRAATDGLTGLPNARSCREALKRMVAQAGRTLSPLSAVLLDLDHFKQINDRFGHGAGDDVLAAAGSTISTTLRTSDFAGRYGGEEFLLLLPDTDAQGARMTAEKVRQAIAQIVVPTAPSGVTASLGVATYPDDAPTGDLLVRQADRALYAAKAGGRNQVATAGVADALGGASADGASAG